VQVVFLPKRVARRDREQAPLLCPSPPWHRGLGTLLRRKHASCLRTQCTLVYEQTLCHTCQILLNILTGRHIAGAASRHEAMISLKMKQIEE